jgi:hypothetical protein
MLNGEVYSIQHYMIKFVSDLRQGGGFLPRVLRFPPIISLFNLPFFHIIWLFDLYFFHIFHIISLFNQLFFRIVHIISLFNFPFFCMSHIFYFFNLLRTLPVTLVLILLYYILYYYYSKKKNARKSRAWKWFSNQCLMARCTRYNIIW